VSIYEAYARYAKGAGLLDEPTSYFSPVEADLDPKLFSPKQILHPSIRTGVLSLLYGFWRSRYNDAESWSDVYLAGSGVSYQWSAARSPGDLDTLITVDWTGFRQANQDYRYLGDEELRETLNHEMQRELWPTTKNWHGFETTFYINQGSDIASIHPYAAYDVTHNSWAVVPNPVPAPNAHPMWAQAVEQDLAVAQDIIDTYNQALAEVSSTTVPGHRLNAEITLRTQARKGAMLFDSIHAGRHIAYGPGGVGFNAFEEYRYKSAKGHGILAAFREMKEELISAGLEDEEGTYGVHLPDPRELLIATAIDRRYKG
jgi:hypothetical protein